MCFFPGRCSNAFIRSSKGGRISLRVTAPYGLQVSYFRKQLYINIQQYNSKLAPNLPFPE